MWVRAILVQLKNFALSADERLTEGARDVVRKRDSPVVAVIWEDATAFCEWLSRKVRPGLLGVDRGRSAIAQISHRGYLGGCCRGFMTNSRSTSLRWRG
jgi:hypothetical protein